MLDPSSLTAAQRRAWDREVAKLEFASRVRAETLFCPWPCRTAGWEEATAVPLDWWAEGFR